MGQTSTNGAGAARSKTLIYVVDDEAMLLELATAILEPEGYEIQTFRDPELAIRAFVPPATRPALVITDFAMHSMNGMQMIEQLRHLEPRLKILLVSGTVGEDIFADSPVKPDGFLAKPYTTEQLIRLVKKMLAGK